MASWLVTGGAGYIGAHVVRALRAGDEQVVVLDDLSSGEAERVGDAPLVRASVGDADAVRRTLRDHGVAGIVHIAAKKQVGESVADPLLYYRENVAQLATLLDVAVEEGVEAFVFSSSAAVYGMPERELVDEDAPLVPMSPYGETKVVGEWMTRALAATGRLRAVSLRYFNVAGAGAAELADPGTFNLIPLVFRALTAGERPQIFGDDYPTRDGTCVRDYVHVADIADAHAAALRHLAGGGDSATFNIGRGEGVSVREVIAAVAEVTGLDVAPVVVARRPGDPARTVAAVDRIRSDLGWRARRDLHDMVESAWAGWVRRHGQPALR